MKNSENSSDRVIYREVKILAYIDLCEFLAFRIFTISNPLHIIKIWIIRLIEVKKEG